MEFTQDIIGKAPKYYVVRKPWSLNPPRSTQRNDVIEWLRETHLVENYVAKLEGKNSPYLLDIISDIYLMILTIDEEKWQELMIQGHNSFRAYVCGIIYRNIHSDSSIIYKKYKHHDRKFVSVSDEMWAYYDANGCFPPTDPLAVISDKPASDDSYRKNLENTKIY